MLDIATRAYNHKWKMDPIVRSLMDTDFYKLLMLQFIWEMHRDVNVTFGLINRTKKVRIADDIDDVELREQLDHARTLTFKRNELIWLKGNTFYGRQGIFKPEFIEWLKDFQLTEYHLEKRDGQYDLTFDGKWTHTTMWEIVSLVIVNELRSRAAIKKLSRFEIDVLYARAKAKLWGKIERLRELKKEVALKVACFATRRRHSFLFQRWCNEALLDGLGDAYIGTSNVLLAMELGVEAIGTNAHELPMVYAALAMPDGIQAVLDSRYAVLKDWRKMYGGNLEVILPDAYGTTRFLKDAPDWAAEMRGARPDSKKPIPGGDEFVHWWRAKGQDPMSKLLILSDGMNVDKMEQCLRHFNGVTNASIGWGTDMSNDFVGCCPKPDVSFDQISIVNKVLRVEGRDAVKLSDNPNKATGTPEAIRLYLEIFGTEGMEPLEVVV